MILLLLSAMLLAGCAATTRVIVIPGVSSNGTSNATVAAGSAVYGFASHHNETGTPFPIATTGTYYQLKMLNMSVTANTTFANGSIFTTVSGVYHISTAASFVGGTAKQYEFSVLTNRTEHTECEAYTISIGVTGVNNVAAECTVYIESGTNVSLSVEQNTAGAADLTIYTAQLRIVLDSQVTGSSSITFNNYVTNNTFLDTGVGNWSGNKSYYDGVLGSLVSNASLVSANFSTLFTYGNWAGNKTYYDGVLGSLSTNASLSATNHSSWNTLFGLLAANDSSWNTNFGLLATNDSGHTTQLSSLTTNVTAIQTNATRGTGWSVTTAAGAVTNQSTSVPTTFYTTINLTAIRAASDSRALCVMKNGTLGKCSNAVNSTGGCTCVS